MALKTVYIEDRNGFELYRVIVQMIDAVPENAGFYLRCDFGEMVKKHAGKVKTLRDT